MMVSLLWRLDGSFRIKECPAEGKADCVIFFQDIESNLGPLFCAPDKTAGALDIVALSFCM